MKPQVLFKFCTAAGGIAILQNRSLFIASPLVLGALDSPDFAHFRVYWSSPHADRYVLQYNRDDKDAGERYSIFMQEERERQTAQAKGHVRYEPNVTRYIAAKKTVNYVRKAEDDKKP